MKSPTVFAEIQAIIFLLKSFWEEGEGVPPPLFLFIQSEGGFTPSSFFFFSSNQREVIPLPLSFFHPSREKLYPRFFFQKTVTDSLSLVAGPGFLFKKAHSASLFSTNNPKMSMSWENGNVSPAHYPNPDQKRKTSSAKGSDHARKKKKEKKEEKPAVIQNMTPMGLNAFKKNEVPCLGQMPDDNDPAVVVEMMKKESKYLPQQPSLL